jgi:hypothetical protein
VELRRVADLLRHARPDTPWGAQADFDKAAVEGYYANSALMWLEEYHVDGFRMDATDYMNIPPQDAAGWALIQRFTDEKNNRWPDKVTIAEQRPDGDWITRPTASGADAATVSLQLPRSGRVRLDLFDVRGRLVRTLVDEARAAGAHVVRWDGRDGSGAPAAAGVYFLRLRAAGETATGRIALLR